MAGATPVQDSSFFDYLQDQDKGGRFHSGRSHSTDDLNIINMENKTSTTSHRQLKVCVTMAIMQVP